MEQDITFKWLDFTDASRNTRIWLSVISIYRPLSLPRSFISQQSQPNRYVLAKPPTSIADLPLSAMLSAVYHIQLVIGLMMEKSASQPSKHVSEAPLQRELEFSFVQSIPKLQGFSRAPASEIKEAERVERHEGRNYELTFQKPSMDVHDLVFLKRTQNDESSNWNEATAINSIQLIKEEQFDESAPIRLEQIQKSEQSSSSEPNQVQEKYVDSLANEEKLEEVKPKRMSCLIKKSDSKSEFIELDCEIPNVYQSEILLNRDIEDYGPDRANICGTDYIQFTKFKISLIGMQKVKIYPQVVKKKSFRIKITHQEDIYNFGVQLRRELYYLPEHYIWFAKLINARLMKKGCKFQQPNNKNGHTLTGNGIFNQGVIYKCSKYRKRWDKRFVLINNQGLYSYKNPKENYTVNIPSTTITELWTNFQMLGSHLIIKLKHGGLKTEFAIPVLDFCQKQDPSNWLFSFYRLLMEHKIHIKV